MCFREISAADTSLLQAFLDDLEGSSAGFRYFATRPLSVIAGHLYTVLLEDTERGPIGYGHLDPEDEVVWLGVSVVKEFRGRGLGYAIVAHLLSEAVKRRVRAVTLSVDSDNEPAIALYRKIGFSEIRNTHRTSYMQWLSPVPR